MCVSTFKGQYIEIPKHRDQEMFNQLTSSDLVSADDLTVFSRQGAVVRALVIAELTGRQNYKLGGTMMSMLVAAALLTTTGITALVVRVMIPETMEAGVALVLWLIVGFSVLYIGIYFYNLRPEGRALKATARLAAYANCTGRELGPRPLALISHSVLRRQSLRTRRPGELVQGHNATDLPLAR